MVEARAAHDWEITPYLGFVCGPFADLNISPNISPNIAAEC